MYHLQALYSICAYDLYSSHSLASQKYFIEPVYFITTAIIGACSPYTPRPSAFSWLTVKAAARTSSTY